MVVLFLLSEVEVAISTRDESKRMRGMERRSKQLRVNYCQFILLLLFTILFYFYT